MQDGLQVVTLTRVLAIKKLQEAAYKVMWNMLHDHILTQMDGQNELEEQFVDELQVRPGLLQMRLILVGVHICWLLVVYYIRSVKNYRLADSNLDYARGVSASTYFC